MRRLIFLICISITTLSVAQKSYIDSHGSTQLCGPILIEDFNDSTYSWFEENYESYEVSMVDEKWTKKLKNTQVDVYLGTWCGDSKKWVPRFVKTWDMMGLDPSQLNFIGLYGQQDQYKQGPNGEEKGKWIHRVPTFVFKEDGKEIGRIVETPNTDLVTDMAQIALGYPSAPMYKAADYIIKLLKTRTIEEINNDLSYHVNSAYKMVGKTGELNNLGYVFLRAGMIQEAKLAFQFNTYFFRNDANVYDSYGEALAEAGEKEMALKMYNKVLELDPENENAKSQIELIGEG